MRLEDKRRSELIAWLEKASADLASSEVLLASGIRSQLHQVLFHCQQTIEKSLKSFLVWNQVTFRWTHDIAEIGNQCIQIDKSLDALIAEVKYLSDYAWEYRYPGEDTEPSKAEAKAGLVAAKKVFREILKKLPKEVQLKFSKIHSRKRKTSNKKRSLK
jgi:HEPN domain-containing protein